jgi:hypothetical protein
MRCVKKDARSSRGAREARKKSSTLLRVHGNKHRRRGGGAGGLRAYHRGFREEEQRVARNRQVRRSDIGARGVVQPQGNKKSETGRRIARDLTRAHEYKRKSRESSDTYIGYTQLYAAPKLTTLSALRALFILKGGY